MRVLPVLALLLLASGCTATDDAGQARRIAGLEAEIQALKAAPKTAAASSEAPELGAQMLELQIRHARLWQAGEAQNWMLSQFQLAELRESFAGVVESNGEHAALQPQRLADVLPMMMKPAVSRLREAIDQHDKAAFESAYDGLSAACSGCHKIADHGFLVIQRPKTPVLDNLKTNP
jgi:hypothetical protein